jgi:hypothetical protein
MNGSSLFFSLVQKHYPFWVASKKRCTNRPASDWPVFTVFKGRRSLMNCGCTIHYPVCAVGEKLFAALVQTQQLSPGPSVQQESRQKAFPNARALYLDHIYGWRQGDVRMRFEQGRWLLETRQQELWSFQLATSDDGALRAWLKERGFWRYAPITWGQPWDRLTGYYHQRDRAPSHSHQASLAGLEQSVEQQETLLLASFRPERDPKTQMALLVGVLVGCSSQPLSLRDRLAIQRKAVHQFVSGGGELTNRHDVKQVMAIIDDAIRLCETLKHTGMATD